MPVDDTVRVGRPGRELPGAPERDDDEAEREKNHDDLHRDPPLRPFVCRHATMRTTSKRKRAAPPCVFSESTRDRSGVIPRFGERWCRKMPKYRLLDLACAGKRYHRAPQ